MDRKLQIACAEVNTLCAPIPSKYPEGTGAGAPRLLSSRSGYCTFTLCALDKWVRVGPGGGWQTYLHGLNEGERLPRHPRADRMVATRDIKMIVLPRPASKRPRAPLTSHVYTLRAHGASDGARGRGWRPGAEGLKSLNFWRLTSSRVGTGCVSWRWLWVS